MNEREKIFARIREALTVPAPLPGQHHGPSHHAKVGTAHSGHANEWLPAAGDSPEDQMARFTANSVDLRTNFRLLNSENEVADELIKMRSAENWQSIASHAGALTDVAVRALGLPVCLTDRDYDVNELERCDVGITECEALIAQTGSVLVTNRSSGGRALSVLPPHHVVLVRRDQLLRDLSSAFQFLKQKYQDNYPSMISFITGPSRTGDIERILVLGAHGPKKLTVFCF